MAQESYSTHSGTLDDRTVRFIVTDSDGALSWRAGLAGWRGNSQLADTLGRAWPSCRLRPSAGGPPAMTVDRLDTEFQCVAVDDPSLDIRTDPTPFAEHLRDVQPVVRFPSLGGDAVMIVLCRQAGVQAYGHIAAFLRRAPLEQQRALWREVPGTMSERHRGACQSCAALISAARRSTGTRE